MTTTATATATRQKFEGIVGGKRWTDDQLGLMRLTVAKACKTDDEFALFLYQAAANDLDPLLRQVHALPRRERDESGSYTTTMSLMVGIDGLRLQAERTKCYAPGRDAVYTYNDEGQLVSATSYLKKRTDDGTWHEFSYTAFFDEYAQRKSDRKTLTAMWESKGHIMLTKCADAGAIRRGFPAETANLYIHEELQNEPPPDTAPDAQPAGQTAQQDKPPTTSKKPEKTSQPTGPVRVLLALAKSLKLTREQLEEKFGELADLSQDRLVEIMGQLKRDKGLPA